MLSNGTARPPSFGTADWKPLSESCLWQRQKDFYSRFGPKAWTSEGGVPSYATSNSYFAEKYVNLLVALSESGSVPIAVLEIGGGSGQLAFLILQIWMERCQKSSLDPNCLLYILTDFAESNLRAYLNHPQFLRHAESGILDFAQFDVTAPNFPITLRFRNQPWHPGCPVVVIASYVFDSLPLDIYSMFSSHHAITQMHAAPVNSVDLQYITKMEPVPDTSNLPEEVRFYLSYRSMEFPSPQAFMLPIASVSFMLWLHDCFNYWQIPLLILVCDKGSSENVELLPATDPELPIAKHSSFSFAVNFQCLRFVAKSRQGHVWESSCERKLKFMAMSWSISAGVRDALSGFDVLPSYLDMHHLFRTSAAFANLSQLMSMLQMSCYDPRLLFGVRTRFSEELTKCNDRQRLDECAHALFLATVRCFALRGTPDFISEIGNLLLAARLPQMALANFHLSLRLYGSDPMVLFRASLVLLDAGQESQAESYMQRAIFIKPDYARTWECLTRFFNKSNG